MREREEEIDGEQKTHSYLKRREERRGGKMEERKKRDIGR